MSTSICDDEFVILNQFITMKYPLILLNIISEDMDSKCCICNIIFLSNKKVFGYSDCNYFICNICFEFNCINKCGLFRNKSDYNKYCDICDNIINSTDYYYCCINCDWDICINCINYKFYKNHFIGKKHDFYLYIKKEEKNIHSLTNNLDMFNNIISNSNIKNIKKFTKLHNNYISTKCNSSRCKSCNYILQKDLVLNIKLIKI